MNLLDNIDKNRLPAHIAIIMDGNGRWAKKRGRLRVFGHRNGKKAVQKIVEAAARLELKNLTLYAFSTENWNRPKTEVETLMKLLVEALKSELKKLLDNNIKLNTIGSYEQLPDAIKNQLADAIEKTKNNTGMVLTIALSYGSREELTNCVKNIADKVKN